MSWSGTLVSCHRFAIAGAALLCLCIELSIARPAAYCSALVLYVAAPATVDGGAGAQSCSRNSALASNVTFPTGACVPVYVEVVANVSDASATTSSSVFAQWDSVEGKLTGYQDANCAVTPPAWSVYFGPDACKKCFGPPPVAMALRVSSSATKTAVASWGTRQCGATRCRNCVDFFEFECGWCTNSMTCEAIDEYPSLAAGSTCSGGWVTGNASLCDPINPEIGPLGKYCFAETLADHSFAGSLVVTDDSKVTISVGSNNGAAYPCIAVGFVSCQPLSTLCSFTMVSNGCKTGRRLEFKPVNFTLAEETIRLVVVINSTLGTYKNVSASKAQCALAISEPQDQRVAYALCGVIAFVTLVVVLMWRFSVVSRVLRWCDVRRAESRAKSDAKKPATAGAAPLPPPPPEKKVSSSKAETKVPAMPLAEAHADPYATNTGHGDDDDIMMLLNNQSKRK